MTERSLTLLEIHFDEASVQLGSKTFGTAADESDDHEAAAASGPDDGDSGCALGRAVGGAMLLVAVVVALAVIAWKLLEDTDLEAAAELDELAEY